MPEWIAFPNLEWNVTLHSLILQNWRMNIAELGWMAVQTNRHGLASFLQSLIHWFEGQGGKLEVCKENARTKVLQICQHPFLRKTKSVMKNEGKKCFTRTKFFTAAALWLTKWRTETFKRKAKLQLRNNFPLTTGIIHQKGKKQLHGSITLWNMRRLERHEKMTHQYIFQTALHLHQRIVHTQPPTEEKHLA